MSVSVTFTLIWLVLHAVPVNLIARPDHSYYSEDEVHVVLCVWKLTGFHALMWVLLKALCKASKRIAFLAVSRTYCFHAICNTALRLSRWCQTVLCLCMELNKHPTRCHNFPDFLLYKQLVGSLSISFYFGVTNYKESLKADSKEAGIREVKSSKAFLVTSWDKGFSEGLSTWRIKEHFVTCTHPCSGSS